MSGVILRPRSLIPLIAGSAPRRNRNRLVTLARAAFQDPLFAPQSSPYAPLPPLRCEHFTLSPTSYEAVETVHALRALARELQGCLDAEVQASHRNLVRSR